jgi:lysophospholipase L1-like esterase
MADLAPARAGAPRRGALGLGLAGFAASAGAAAPMGERTGAAGPGSGGAAAPTRGQVVLLGDSVFDNAAYVAGGPDVVAQLRGALPGGWRAALAAVDGAVVEDVPRQLARAPADATYLVVSAGGNDALRAEGVLGAPARSVGEALARLDAVRARFLEAYRAMLDALLGRGLPAAVCTIYDPRFPDPGRRRLAVAGLALFNDAIAREAFARGLPLIDLRLVCGEDADFANPIEPSARGGAKIAREIARVVAEHDFARRRSEVFAGRPRDR